MATGGDGWCAEAGDREADGEGAGRVKGDEGRRMGSVGAKCVYVWGGRGVAGGEVVPTSINRKFGGPYNVRDQTPSSRGCTVG